jgi:hypothetical protein
LGFPKSAPWRTAVQGNGQLSFDIEQTEKVASELVTSH